MSDRLSVRIRVGFLLGLLLMGIMLAHPARAVEKFRPVLLPDAGHGSTARAVAQMDTFKFGVVGAQRNLDGSSNTILWGITVDPNDPSGNTVVSTPLPTPPGTGGEATGIAFTGGDVSRPVICGFLGTDVTGTQAVLWTQDSTGHFTNTILDDAASVANAVGVRRTPMGLIIVVCGKYRLPGGAWHACLWQWDAQGRRRLDLGTLGGRNSEATAILYGNDGGIWRVAGNAQRADGRWIATLIEGEGIFYSVQPLPTPPNAQSFVHALYRDLWGRTFLTGETLGPTYLPSATIWTGQGQNFTGIPLGNPAGFANCAARGIVFNGGSGNDLLVIGSAWNQAGAQVGIGALPMNQIFDDPFFFDALLRTESVGNNETITIHGLNAATPGGVIVGVGRRSGSPNAQAVALLPTKFEVPQIIAILIGLLIPQVGGNPGSVPDLWQADNRALRFSPAPGDNRVALEFGCRSILAQAGQSRAPRMITFGGSLMPRNAQQSPACNITLQLYNPTTRQWTTVLSDILVSSLYFRKTVTIPAPERFAVPGGGPLRGRLLVQSRVGASQDWVFTLDYIEQDNLYWP